MKSRAEPTTSARRHRQGFALAVTVILLAVAALALVATSRLTVRRAVMAVQREKDLQRRWGTMSIQHAFKNQFSMILLDAERAKSASQLSVEKTITLGREPFDLVFGDEQAKFNISPLLGRESGRDALQVLRELLGPNPLAQRIKILPQNDAGQQFLPSFARIFDGPSASELLDAGTGIRATDLLTCWGDGRLNLRRANSAVIRAKCEPILGSGGTGRLLFLRDQSPQLTLLQMAEDLRLSDARRQWLLSNLTLTSDCHSLWIRSGPRIRLELESASNETQTLDWQ